MRKVTSLFLVTAGLLSGFGCGDDTATGGGNTGGSGAGNTGGENTGAGSTGGNNPGGGGVGGDGAGPVGGSTQNFNCDPSTETPPTLALSEVASGFDNPVSAKSPPGRPDTLFVVEQGGTISIIDGGAALPTPFLDVSDAIVSGGEQGLLGLAFHPEYETNGRFFIHYSSSDNGLSTVMEYHRSDADENVADPDSVQLVLQHPTAQPNHNGGDLSFGPNDGFLYITLGDGGTQGDPGCDAQNTDNLLGKISRVDVDAAATAEGYPAAAGNPDGGKYYHLGFRNPWRFGFDPCNGDLYIADVGQNEWEEVSVAEDGAGPLNFGWPVREGAHDYPNNDCDPEPVNPVEPIAEYPHKNTPICGGGSGSISGGFVYRGSAIPSLRGWYFYGDYCSGDVYILKAENGEIVSAPVSPGFSLSQVSGFGQDGNGEVYAIDHNGVVNRIVAQ